MNLIGRAQTPRNSCDVDLTSWDMTVAPRTEAGLRSTLLAKLAATMKGYSGTAYIAGEFDSGSVSFGLEKRRFKLCQPRTTSQRLVVGFNVTTHTIAYMLNASSWPSPGTLHVVVDVFSGANGLLVTARVIGSQDLLFFTVPDPFENGTATFLGSLPCPYCGSATYDSVGQLLYVLVDSQGSSDDAGGELWSISTECGFFVVANVTLPVPFAFPQWDAASRSVVGLTLVQASGGSYTRNVTLLYEPGVWSIQRH